MAYRCGQGTRLGWVENFQREWATNGDLFKLLGTLLAYTYSYKMLIIVLSTWSRPNLGIGTLLN